MALSLLLPITTPAVNFRTLQIQQIYMLKPEVGCIFVLLPAVLK